MVEGKRRHDLTQKWISLKDGSMLKRNWKGDVLDCQRSWKFEL